MLVAVPMLKENRSAQLRFSVKEVRPFTDKQMLLVTSLTGGDRHREHTVAQELRGVPTT
jgi:hypothetical protein